MATRSNIGILNDNGTVTAIYCHWDGYRDGVGRKLYDHYKDVKKVRELISLGAISILGSEISPSEYSDIRDGKLRGLAERFDPQKIHTFDNPFPGVTVSYFRDRGESPLQIMNFNNEDDYYQSEYLDEYVYLFKDNKWYCEGKLLEFRD